MTVNNLLLCLNDAVTLKKCNNEPVMYKIYNLLNITQYQLMIKKYHILLLNQLKITSSALNTDNTESSRSKVLVNL